MIKNYLIKAQRKLLKIYENANKVKFYWGEDSFINITLKYYPTIFVLILIHTTNWHGFGELNSKFSFRTLTN